MAKKRKSETPAVASSAGIQSFEAAPRGMVASTSTPSTRHLLGGLACWSSPLDAKPPRRPDLLIVLRTQAASPLVRTGSGLADSGEAVSGMAPTSRPYYESKFALNELPTEMPMFRVVVKANLSMPMADNLIESIKKSFAFLDAHGAGFNSHPHHAHQPHHKAC